ncbi:hypothetical protein Pfo_002728, partial [Paulownia fortunei]
MVRRHKNKPSRIFAPRLLHNVVRLKPSFSLNSRVLFLIKKTQKRHQCELSKGIQQAKKSAPEEESAKLCRPAYAFALRFGFFICYFYCLEIKVQCVTYKFVAEKYYKLFFRNKNNKCTIFLICPKSGKMTVVR